MTESIIQDNHETIRHTITVEPDGATEGIDTADEFHWALTTDRTLGEGDAVLEKGTDDVTTVDAETFEVELSPADTRGVDPDVYWAEVTIVWGAEPKTVHLEPAIRVFGSVYDSTD